MHVLFQSDLSGDPPDCSAYFQDQRVTRGIGSFTRHLVDGFVEHREEIDSMIAQHCRNWPVDRMGAVERNILRVGTFELMYDWVTPAGVVIDEAIEIAKKFGSNESPSFVNGVLDGIRKGIEQGKVVCAREQS